ncbi:MAG: biopolymer transporter ExbD [Methylococcaceae bacterium]|nr:biopolymer transporter ExbD [Methylococcaceae bacterium]
MNFHRRKKEKVDISLTPMIDAVFLLLIFFMVTTTFNHEAELKIKLPEAKGAEQSDADKKIVLVINAAGEYALLGEDGNPHELAKQNLEGLQDALLKLAGQDHEMPFVISADGKTPHQAVISALDVASELGFSHITFTAKQPDASQAE